MRHHIDFIQAQLLPWQDAEPFGFPGSRAKLLSRDDETGAFSIILQLPAGAGPPAATRHADEEFYVLDGTMEGEVAYGEHSYAFLPAGFAGNGLRSQHGCTLLYFQSGEVAAPLRSDAAQVSARHV